MCGIVGYQGENHRHFTEHGLILTHHRGPDETVLKTFPRVGLSLGLNRLAIRDLHKGLYPFFYQGRYLIYNGEIYNTGDLQCIAHYVPKTRCDGELILPLFARHGVGAFDFLVGMFAIAIYDTNNNALILARDKFGEKPLYYKVTKDRVCFGSELRLFALDGTISREAILRYLAFGYQPFQSTIYDGVSKVLPGEVVVIDLATHKVVRHRYATDQIKSKPDVPLKDLVRKLDQTLRTIVEEKIIADVPVGVYLSGGVDSSTLAALVVQSTRHRVKTFSIAFDFEEYDESSASRSVARYLKTDHTEIPVSAENIQAIWNPVIRALDEPFADPAIFPTYLLSQEAKKYVTVILSGEGADEFFGGYPRYRNHLPAARFPRFSAALAKILLTVIPSRKVVERIGVPELLYTSAQYHTLWHSGFVSRSWYVALLREAWHLLEQTDFFSSLFLPLKLFFYDLRYYVGEQLCMKIDKMTMLHSLESRAPYLDVRLFPFMVESARLLRRGHQNKYLLRQVAKHYVPYEIANREKHGFSLPLEHWLRSGLRDKVENAKSPHAAICSVLPPKTVQELIDGYLFGKHNDDLAVWSVVILDAWLKEHVRQ